MSILDEIKSGYSKERTYTPQVVQVPKFEFNPGDSVLNYMTPTPPKDNRSEEEKQRRIAKLHATNEFFTALGNFAGGGYAPVEKKQENVPMLRALSNADRLRNTYDQQVGDYNNRLFAIKANDFNRQKSEHNQQYQNAVQWDMQERRINHSDEREDARTVREDKRYEDNKQFQADQAEKNRKYNSSEADKVRNYNRDKADKARLDAIEDTRQKAQQKEIFTSVVLSDGDQVDLTRSQANQFVANIERLYSELKGKTNLSPLEREIRDDLTILQGSLGTEGYSQDKLRAFVAKYLPTRYNDEKLQVDNILNKKPINKQYIVDQNIAQDNVKPIVKQKLSW